VDGVWCHAAFARERNLHFPLLADFEPKGAVSRLYGAYREKEGTSERALFVVDARGTIAWSYLSPIGVNRGADGVRYDGNWTSAHEFLDALRSAASRA
jgi:peroxiredoxin